MAAAVPPTLPGKPRRRYCWHLPERLTGFVGEGEYAYGQPHSVEIRLTAVAGEAMRVGGWVGERFTLSTDIKVLVRLRL